MTKIALVTDSTPCLTPELIAKYNLHIVPLKVQWGDKTYLDGLDISPSEFYTRLERPKACQLHPSPAG
jgi:fatty acid-binding protein DegV